MMAPGCGKYTEQIWEEYILNNYTQPDFADHIKMCSACQDELKSLTNITKGLYKTPYDHIVTKDVFTSLVLREMQSNYLPYKKDYLQNSTELIKSIRKIPRAIPILAAGIIPLLLIIQMNINKPQYSTGLLATSSVSISGEPEYTGTQVSSNGVTHISDSNGGLTIYSFAEPIRSTAGVTEFH